MNKLITNNTDFMVFLFTIASIGLTFMKIMDVKDFGALALLVLGYKFAKGQIDKFAGQTPDKPVVG